MRKIAYKICPLFLRLLEKLKFHNYKQPFPITKIKNMDIEGLKKYLKNKKFERGILAWRDPGEILNMRKIDEENKRFQYHIRAFDNGEIRGHYEYAPESNPIKHMREKIFLAKKDFFNEILSGFLKNNKRNENTNL